MHYHLILSNRCNLKCSYCGGTRDVVPLDPEYPMEALYKFLAQDPDVVVNFYGGEPMLRPDLVRAVMDNVKGRFVIQTNGLLLPELGDEYIRRMHSILLSLDGGKEITDAHRGSGVFDKVVSAAQYARKAGFTGDLVARMVASLDGDIYRDVMDIHETGVFDHIHWQIDFELFWDGGGEPEAVRAWLDDVYNPGVSKLTREWVNGLERHEDFGPVPITVLASAMVDGREARLWCGSGLDFWAVTTKGNLTACPVCIDRPEFFCGNINDTAPDKVRDAMPVLEPCPSCDIYNICGGRCLLANRSQDNMYPGGFEMMCSSVRYLVAQLRGIMPRLRVLKMRDPWVAARFRYPELNNGCEIVP